MRGGNPGRRQPWRSAGEPLPQEDAGREHRALPRSGEMDRSANVFERKSQNYQKSG